MAAKHWKAWAHFTILNKSFRHSDLNIWIYRQLLNEEIDEFDVNKLHNLSEAINRCFQ